MSRIGKKPVQIPAGVTVAVNGNNVSVKGSKGELNRSFSELVNIAVEGEEVLVTRVDDSTASNAQQGLTRTLINNMVIGVSEGYTSKANCVNGVESVKKNAAEAEIVEE